VRLKAFGICSVAVMLLAASIDNASAAKSDLWLVTADGGGPSTRAKVGEVAEVLFYLDHKESGCSLKQPGTLRSNGEPVDEFDFTKGSVLQCSEGTKVSGEVKSVEMSPVEGAHEGTVTVATSSLHIFVEPWCVYTLPAKWRFPFRGATGAPNTFSVTGKLDKPASFATCESTFAAETHLWVYQTAEPTGEGYFQEGYS
jgi:hypothetical protein